MTSSHMWRCLPERSPALRNCIEASTQHSRVFRRWCTRCLIKPSAERSHGMSSALTTLGRVSYCLRKFCEAATSSAWKVQLAEPDSAGPLSSKGIFTLSNVGRWFVGVLARRQFVRRPFHDLLEQEMHEQE